MKKIILENLLKPKIALIFQKRQTKKSSSLLKVFSFEERNSTQFKEQKKLLSEFKPHVIYMRQDSKSVPSFFVFMNSLSQKSPLGKSLSPESTNFILGTRLSEIILNNVQLHSVLPLELEFSSIFGNVLKKSLIDFYLGLQQRSLSNKIPFDSTIHDEKISLLIRTQDYKLKQSLLNTYKAMQASMKLCRSLVNFPANILNPESFARLIKSQVKDKNQVKIDVIGYESLKKKGFHFIRAVGKGSKVKPCLVHLRYRPEKSRKGSPYKKVALVGKGVTFDSGGYSMKPHFGMRNMKKDMGGSAVCLSAFLASVEMNLPLELHCILCLAENLVSDNAFKPGDIIVSKEGLKVEIDNTDAEGRLVLADGLTLAREQNPDTIVDVATLTGAARVATGPLIDPYYTNSSQLSTLIEQCSHVTGDWIWRFPLFEDYEFYLESSVADTLNSAPTSFAGSLTAALFLQKFVKTVPWVHIDTFMWTDKAFGPYAESGPTAKCVRLLIEFLKRYSKVT